jgi:hypothetical protein
MRIAVWGVDIAKSIFHLYGVDKRGRSVLSRRVSRGWSCPRQTGQVAGCCALTNWRGERIPRAQCGCISL